MYRLDKMNKTNVSNTEKVSINEYIKIHDIQGKLGKLINLFHYL